MRKIGVIKMENTLRMSGLSKKFRKNEVLHDISCELRNGIYGLLGPNGAGKTTLMRCIAGVLAYNGEIYLNGKKVNQVKPCEIGYLPQQFGLFPELTVYEMLEYMCNIKKIERRERKIIIEKCITRVNLQEKKKEKIKKLSGGMKRRLGIAQALLSDPTIIIFDEPTAGLDPEERMRFKEIVAGLNKEKIVIISTHIVEDVEACCNHIIVIDRGNILKVGTITDIQHIAKNRIMETTDNTSQNILYTEKSYIRNDRILYRVITKDEEEDCVDATVEDGYLCLLKSK